MRLGWRGCSIQSEVHLDVHFHRNRFAAEHPRPESILLHRLNRFLVQTLSQIRRTTCTRWGFPCASTIVAITADTLILCSFGLLRKLRVGREDEFGCGNISSYMVDSREG